METKAAKTLGIIVGGFILCWLPFFTMYLVRAFCPNHIHPTVFSVLFWLGYCNSAINPCIYALFSKDFRFAFKRIICCRCSCIQRANTLRRGSDGSQLAMRSVLRFVLQSARILRFIFARSSSRCIKEAPAVLCHKVPHRILKSIFTRLRCLASRRQPGDLENHLSRLYFGFEL